MSNILIVDDNPDILDALDLLLSLHNHSVTSASNAKDALLAVRQKNIGLVIQDMNFSQGMTSGDEGHALFNSLRQEQPNLPIILLTAWTSLDSAVSLVKAGAADYLPKPWDDSKLLALISQYTAHDVAKPVHEPQFVYQSQVMSDLLFQAKKVAKSHINVLISGPNGAGKEQLADIIHHHSPRAQHPLIKVNMGALPHDLMEAELFGCEKGAFTGANERRIGRFEAADGGTLFLDEIGNLSLVGQMKLLRVLQTGEFERIGSSTTQKVDVRVLSATNANLNADVLNGLFREDLYYRLNTVELTLPLLCERGDDAIVLAEHFIGDQFKLTEDAIAYIKTHTWPGNVRELQNACQRALIFASNNSVSATDLGAKSSLQPRDEASQIEHALTKHNWVIMSAAKELGLSRQALYRRIEKYNICKPD